MAVDVTEKRRLEDALRNSQRLESLAVLAGGLAHDYNNLFAAIFGSIDRAASASDCGPKASQYLAHATEAIGRARALTSQLLTFGRGGQPVLEPVDLERLSEAALRFALSGSTVRFEVDVPDDLWPCNGDESQLLQVLDNLLINARQAMGGSGSVRISARNVPSDGRRPDLVDDGRLVRLDIEDEGPGIADGLRSKIFDPFYTTRAQGTGLGLAVAWSIVKRHGGHIEVGDGRSGGACFSIWLPAAAEAPDHPETRDEPAETSAPRMAGPVLVLDDDPMVRDVVASMLERLGFEVDAVGDAAAALERVGSARDRGSQYLFGLIDLTNPGRISGLDLAERIDDVPLIAMSGYTDSAAMVRPEEHGFAAALPKPFITADLERVVATALREA
jgi:CheY-like chemotaxis protein